MIPVTRRFTLRGDCMLPLLEPGDEVWVRPGPLEGARGRLVAYARFTGPAPELAVHRLLEDGRTRADARLAADPAGEAAAFMGRVVALRRGGRLAALETPRGRAWDAFSRGYSRLFMAWWREGVLNRLDGVLGDGPRQALRAAALAVPRLVFKALFAPAGS